MDIDYRDPRFLRWAGAILVVLVIVPLYFTSTMYPITYAARQEKVKELQARHETLSRDLEKARLLVRNLERVEREYEILHEQWQVASTLLPEQNEMANLLRKVTAAGTQSGVDFKLFRPDAPRPRDFYNENPVAVKIQGGYHQTGVFLSRLANLNRIVNVNNVKMTGVQDQKDTPFTVETEMTLTAYTLGTGPAPAGTQDAGGRQLAQAANGAPATAGNQN